MDGEVVSGSTEVDESALTGESMPAEKSPGDSVLTGALNGTGGFIMRATRVGADTTLARVIRLVEEAQGSAAPVQRLADRVSAWFVPAVGLIALTAAVVWLFRGAGAGVVGSGVAVRHADAGSGVHHRLPLRAGAGDADGNHRRRGQGRRARHPDSQRRRAGDGAPG